MLNRIVILFIGIAAALPGMHLATTPRADATIPTMFWRGQIEAGGPEMTFNGTIQEVIAQIRKIKPDFPVGLNISRSTPLPNDDDGHELKCGLGGNGIADKQAILEGIDYLHGITGNCGVNAGSACCRISCAYNAGIWLCSDHGQDVQWPCHLLGDIAKNVCLGCPYFTLEMTQACQGQEMWPEQAGGFHVDVGEEEC